MVDAFLPDTESLYLGVLPDVPLAIFQSLPPHRSQRRTDEHAEVLRRSGVLNRAHDEHRAVVAAVLGRLPDIARAFAEDPLATLRRGCKVDGHTRADEMWPNGWAPSPKTVRVTVYACATPEALLRLYQTYNASVSAKVSRDTMQSTLRTAGIHAASAILSKAKIVRPVLEHAAALLWGQTTTHSLLLHLDAIPGYEPHTKLQAEEYRAMPDLPLVNLFKPAIIDWDRLMIAPAFLPTAPYGVHIAYLSILYRDGAKGLDVLQHWATEDAMYTGGKMDTTYAVRHVVRSLRQRATQSRSRQLSLNLSVLACILHCYERHGTDLTADKFPIDQRIIARFNPRFVGAAAPSPTSSSSPGAPAGQRSRAVTANKTVTTP
jgi:hypothetical protein